MSTITDPNYGQRDPASVTSPDGEGKIIQRKRWTREEIMSMPSAEYARHLSDPNFVAAIDNPPPDENPPQA